MVDTKDMSIELDKEIYDIFQKSKAVSTVSTPYSHHSTMFAFTLGQRKVPQYDEDYLKAAKDQGGDQGRKA